MFFIQVVRGHPGGRLQFSGAGSKMAWLASAFSSIRSFWLWQILNLTQQGAAPGSGISAVCKNSFMPYAIANYQ